MLQHSPFYWKTIRKSIVAFGNMFSDVYIERKDTADNTSQTLLVPLTYSPKQPFIARIEQQPNIDDAHVQIVLPAMAYEFLGLIYDPTRKVSPITQNRIVGASTTALSTQYAPTPYNLNFNLYIYSKNQDDGFQIIEQIIPFFNPDYNLVLKAIPDLNIKNDLSITLDNISFEDTYESDLTARRSIIWTLTFTLKLNFYGPKADQNIIKTVYSNIFSDTELANTIQNYSVTVSPANATPGSNVTYVETFTDY